MGFATPRIRLARPADQELGGAWSVMDFATGSPPLGDLNGIAALRRPPTLFARLPAQLAGPMAALHALDPEPVSAAVDVMAPTVAWRVDRLLEHFEVAASALDRPDLVAAVRTLCDRRPSEGATVICHGDFHPFNLLVSASGDITVVDWTAAIRAEPAYDVAFTAMLVGNPPLDAPGPLSAIVRRVGARLARRFVTRYRMLAPDRDLSNLDWYGALHGMRILIEAAGIEARDEPGATGHPFGALVPAASSAVTSFTGTEIATPG